MVRFIVLDSRYYDGTLAGYEKALENSVEIVEPDMSNPDEAVEKWRKKYPAKRYDIDDICWK